QARNLFDGFLSAGICQSTRVDRERLNIDLLVCFVGCKPLVIENKVKSMPRQEQLDEYREKCERHRLQADYLLLSLVPQPWETTLESYHGWRYLSYAELANRI